MSMFDVRQVTLSHDAEYWYVSGRVSDAEGDVFTFNVRDGSVDINTEGCRYIAYDEALARILDFAMLMHEEITDFEIATGRMLNSGEVKEHLEDFLVRAEATDITLIVED